MPWLLRGGREIERLRALVIHDGHVCWICSECAGCAANVLDVQRRRQEGEGAHVSTRWKALSAMTAGYAAKKTEGEGHTIEVKDISRQL